MATAFYRTSRRAIPRRVSKPDGRPGFTLIELLISIAIFAILTAILAWNFDRYNRNNDVRRAAERLVANLRLVQNKAMTGQTIRGETETDPGVPTGGFGLHINLDNPDLSNTSYRLFADRERWTGTDCPAFRNERYDRGAVPLPNDCLVDNVHDDLEAGPTEVLPEDIIIESLTVDGIPDLIRSLDIAFQPPKPIPYVGVNDPLSGAQIGRTARIDLRHAVTGLRRRITVVGASGQISLTTPP